MIRLNEISDFCERYGCTPMHPLITIVDFEQLSGFRQEIRSCGFYCVMLKDKGGKLTYGLGKYEYDASTLLFIAPDQVFGILPEDYSGEPRCRALLFDARLISNSALSSRFNDYTFFSYECNEALHMTPAEHVRIRSLFDELEMELMTHMDENNRYIVLAYLSLLFSYSMRFYERQFSSRANHNNQLLKRFNEVLTDYFSGNLPIEQGLPSVAYCAQQLSLSPNYFGDLVKKTTGHTAKEHIHVAVVERVKHLIVHTKMSISEIAYHVGFKYPHHLSRVFRHVTGISPIEFRTRR